MTVDAMENVFPEDYGGLGQPAPGGSCRRTRYLTVEEVPRPTRRSSQT
jgi:hypothetical protein